MIVIAPSPTPVPAHVNVGRAAVPLNAVTVVGRVPWVGQVLPQYGVGRGAFIQVIYILQHIQVVGLLLPLPGILAVQVQVGVGSSVDIAPAPPVGIAGVHGRRIDVAAAEPVAREVVVVRVVGHGSTVGVVRGRASVVQHDVEARQAAVRWRPLTGAPAGPVQQTGALVLPTLKSGQHEVKQVNMRSEFTEFTSKYVVRPSPVQEVVHKIEPCLSQWVLVLSGQCTPLPTDTTNYKSARITRDLFPAVHVF